MIEIPQPPSRKPFLRKRRRSRALWYLVPLAGFAIWLSLGNDPLAEQIRDDVTGARTQTIVDETVSMKPQSFAYYEFTIPPGAVNVRVTGQFRAESHSQKRTDKNIDNNIETFILTDSAFVIWRNGYSTGSRYESGRVSQANLDAPLPAGSGIYYLVFNNRFAPRTEKAVHATVLFQYQTWMPEWLLRIKERLWNWMGLN